MLRSQEHSLHTHSQNRWSHQGLFSFSQKAFYCGFVSESLLTGSTIQINKKPAVYSFLFFLRLSSFHIYTSNEKAPATPNNIYLSEWKMLQGWHLVNKGSGQNWSLQSSVTQRDRLTQVSLKKSHVALQILSHLVSGHLPQLVGGVGGRGWRGVTVISSWVWTKAAEYE